MPWWPSRADLTLNRCGRKPQGERPPGLDSRFISREGIGVRRLDCRRMCTVYICGLVPPCSSLSPHPMLPARWRPFCGGSSLWSSRGTVELWWGWERSAAGPGGGQRCGAGRGANQSTRRIELGESKEALGAPWRRWNRVTPSAWLQPGRSDAPCWTRRNYLYGA